MQLIFAAACLIADATCLSFADGTGGTCCAGVTACSVFDATLGPGYKCAA